MLKSANIFFVTAALVSFAATGFAGEPIKKTVEALFAEKNTLSGKQVQITGNVVKVNNGIMNRNFLHVQDGTGTVGSNDITVTSQQTAQIGDKVAVTGRVATDVDFGAGYTYPVLVERAEIKKLP
jgi:hypothetical protein